MTRALPEAASGPRVLMVLKRMGGAGGLQLQARRVAMRLLERGVPVRVVMHARRPSEQTMRWARRLPTVALLAPEQWSFTGRLFTYLIRHRHEYDVVHVHGFGPEAFAAIAARRVTGRPLIVKPSTAGEGTKLRVYSEWTARAPFPLRGAWRGVDAWASLSVSTDEELLRMGVPAERIVRLPNGVDLQRFRPLPHEDRAALRAELGLAPEDLVVCTLSRLTPHKRVDLLLRAFQETARDCPQARLWIAGTGEQSEALKALTAQGPAGDRVRFWGDVKPGDVPRLLQAADVFALLSLWEGLPNSLLEAMACGVAPLVSRVSGSADVVQEGASGLVVPPDDEAAARAALRRLLTEPETRARLGAAARLRVQEQYSLDLTVDRLQALYESCCAGETPAQQGRLTPAR